MTNEVEKNARALLLGFLAQVGCITHEEAENIGNLKDLIRHYQCFDLKTVETWQTNMKKQ